MKRLILLLPPIILLASCSSTIQKNEHIYLHQDATLTPVAAPYALRSKMHNQYPVPAYNQKDRTAPSLLPPGGKVAAYKKEMEMHKYDSSS